MSIEADLKTYLIAQSGISSLIGSGTAARMFLNARAQGSVLPAIVYQRLTGGHHHDMDSASGWADPLFEITAYASTGAGVIALAEAIRQELQGFAGTMGSSTVHCVLLEDEDDFYDEPSDSSNQGVHGRSMDYRIQHTESIPTF